jgi:WD40 repeat protein
MVVSALAFSPDDKVLVSAGHDGELHFWDRATGQLQESVNPEAGAITSMAFAANGEYLATAGESHAIKLWQWRTRTELPVSHNQGDFLTAIAVRRDGRFLAASLLNRSVRLWDGFSNQVVRTLPVERESWARANSIDLSPDGETLVCNTGGPVIQLLETASGRPLHGFPFRRMGGLVSFSRGGRRLIAAVCADDLQVWEVDTQRERLRKRYTGNNAQPAYLAFSPDDSSLAVGLLQGEVIVQDTITGQKKISFLPGGPDPIRALAWSPNGRMLAVSGDNFFQLRDSTTGKLLWTLTGHEGTVIAAAFSSDGTTLACGSSDGTVRRWDMASGNLVQTIRLALPGAKILQIAFTPDGRHLLTANGNGTLYVLRIAAPRTE